MRGRNLVKDAVFHLDDFAAILVDQQGVAAVAHPDGAGGRRHQAEIAYNRRSNNPAPRTGTARFRHRSSDVHTSLAGGDRRGRESGAAREIAVIGGNCGRGLPAGPRIAAWPGPCVACRDRAAHGVARRAAHCDERAQGRGGARPAAPARDALAPRRLAARSRPLRGPPHGPPRLGRACRRRARARAAPRARAGHAGRDDGRQAWARRR